MEKITKWFYKDEAGAEIEMPLESWFWHVVYKDGTDLVQFDKTGRFHQFKEINQNQVEIFEMINADNPDMRHSIAVGRGMSQIFQFHRRLRAIDMDGAGRLKGNTDRAVMSIPCFGFAVKDAKVTRIVNDERVQEPLRVYHFIMPDGRLVITTNRDQKLIEQ